MDSISKHFQILDIAMDATYEEAKIAYRDMMQVWHPDRFVNNERQHQKATEKSKELNAAWENVKTFYDGKFASTSSRKNKDEQNQQKNNKRQQEYAEKKVYRGKLHPEHKEGMAIEVDVIERLRQRFSVKDLTILSKATGHVWAKDTSVARGYFKSGFLDIFSDEGQLKKGLISLKQANEFLRKMNYEKYGGYNGWRIPNVDDVDSLFDILKWAGVGRGEYSDYLAELGFNVTERNFTAYLSINNDWPSSLFTYEGKPLRELIPFGGVNYLWPVTNRRAR